MPPVLSNAIPNNEIPAPVLTVHVAFDEPINLNVEVPEVLLMGPTFPATYNENPAPFQTSEDDVVPIV